MTHHRTVMDRLSQMEIAVSPERDLVDAISAWLAGPQDLGLMEYTGLDTTELAAIVVDERSVSDLLHERTQRSRCSTAA